MGRTFPICRPASKSPEWTSARPAPRQGAADKEEFYEAFRGDKGRRVLAGMLHARSAGHLMIVDDDDFVSRRLASFVAANRAANGWYFRTGYVWGDSGAFSTHRLASLRHVTHRQGGSVGLPASLEAARDLHSKDAGQSHSIRDHLASAGAPLAAYPLSGRCTAPGTPRLIAARAASCGNSFFANPCARGRGRSQVGSPACS